MFTTSSVIPTVSDETNVVVSTEIAGSEKLISHRARGCTAPSCITLQVNVIISISQAYTFSGDKDTRDDPARL